MKIKSLLLYILILSPALLILFLFCATIFKPGYIIFTDVTEPLNTSKLYQRYLFTYSNDIGESLAEKSRIPLFFLIYGIQKIASAPENFIKVKFLLLLIANTVSFIWCLSVVTKGKIRDKSFLFPAVIGSVFFNINYWSTNRLAHFGLFFSTVTVCLTFALYYKFLFLDHKYKHLLILDLLLAFFIGTPHTVLLVFLIVIVLNISALFSRDRIGLKKALSGLLIFTASFIAVSLYWILPFLASQSTPDAILSPEIFNLLSRNSTLVKSALLQGYWWKEIVDYPQPFMEIIGLSLLILIFVFRKGLRTKKLPILLIAIIGILFGSNNIISGPIYNYLMFFSPIKNFGWIFREVDKINLLSAFGYSMVVSLALQKTPKDDTRKIWKVIEWTLPYIAVIALLINPLAFFVKTIKENYTPQIVPQDFVTVDKLLQADKEEFNTLWFPGAERTYWSNTKENRFVLSNLVSEKPTITTRSDLINLSEYLLDPDNLMEINVGKALDFFGVKYLIIRKDSRDYLGMIVDERLLSKNDPGLKLVYSGDSLSLYKNNYFSGLSKICTNTITTNKGLDIFKELDMRDINPANTILLFTDGPLNQLKESVTKNRYVCEGEDYLDFALNNFLDKTIFPADYVINVESGKADRWRKSSLYNLTHAENKFFFKNYGISTNQLDYQKMVVTALDGLQLKNSKVAGTGLDAKITFSQYPNMQLIGNKFLYKSIPADFKFYWDIVRSDSFKLKENQAIRIRFDSSIPKEIIPHFKITTYDEAGKELSIKFIYPNELGVCDEILKTPEKTYRADFSIWTLSKREGEEYSYEIGSPKMEDVTENTQNLVLNFSANARCQGSCTLYARVLESNRGGLMTITAEGQSFDISTTAGFLSDRYNWRQMGTINLQKGEAQISLENKQGVNSVGGLVFLQKEELSKLENYSEDVKAQCVAPVIKGNTRKSDIQGILPPASVYTNTFQINPTKYLINPQNNEGEAVLLFAKPYSKNWTNEDNQAGLVNGFLNGWVINNSSEVTVEYLPQRFFYLGVVISTLSLLAILTMLKMKR